MTTPTSPAGSGVVSARGLGIGLVATLVVLGAAAALGAARSPGAPAGETLIVMDDYRFAPGRLSWRAGDTVTLTLLNRSSSRPGKPHEIMFGRVPLREEGTFGPVQGDGYREQLLDGAVVELVGGERVSMVMAETARVTGVDPMTLMPAGMDMSGQPMRMGMDFMVVLQPGGSLTVRFRVPDRPGTWEFGCFQQDGQHYLNGMKGDLIVAAP